MSVHQPLATELMAETLDHDRLQTARRQATAARAHISPSDRSPLTMTFRRIFTFSPPACWWRSSPHRPASEPRRLRLLLPPPSNSTPTATG